MKHLSIKTLLGRSVLVAAMLVLVTGSASAATYNLRADATAVDHGNGTGAVPAWGYALVSYDLEDGAGTVLGDDLPVIPGPTIYVPAGQGLTINLTNNLGEATSIVVHGQKLTGTPTRNLDGRVTSFTDAAAATTGTAVYSWTAAELKAGTFLYNSGSHPAKQVHMGLYGAVVVDADSDGDPATLEAYPGVFYDRDIVVIYSEVDPALRIAEGAAQALNFKPKFFLVNGDPSGNSVLTDATPAELNSRVLIRFVNAGMKEYVPTLLGEDLEWVAESGNQYPHVRRSYSAFLSAGKTMDAIWVPATWDRHALYDRRLHMSRNGYPFGGLRAFLDSANTTLPEADAGPDQLHVPMITAGTPTQIQLTGGAVPASSLFEWALVGFPAGSSAALSDPTAANPTFTIDEPGTYTAQLVVSAWGIESPIDTVNIFTNLPPVAVPGDDLNVDQGVSVTVDGSDSYDPDASDTLTYHWKITAPPGFFFERTTAQVQFGTGFVGTYTAELTVSDGELTDTKTMYVHTNVYVNDPPIALDDFFEVLQWRRNEPYTPNNLYVLINDSDADSGGLDEATLSIVTAPMNGASATPILVGGQMVVEYIPKVNFKGTDFFTYSICDFGGECSEAQVMVNVIRTPRNN